MYYQIKETLTKEENLELSKADEDKKQANVQFKDTLLTISALSKIS